MNGKKVFTAKPHKEKIKRSRGERILFDCVFVFLCIFTATFIIAYLFAFMNAFKDPLEYILNSRFSLPKRWEFENFIEVFSTLETNGAGYFEMVGNSLFFVLTGTLPSIISTALAAYAYARFKFVGRHIIFLINLILLTVSMPGSQAAYYKLFCDLGMRNSWKFIFGCFGGFGGNFIIYAGFWKGVDWAYAEAGYLDGANENQVLWNIMMPQALPMLGVFFLLSFISSWSSHEFTMIYMPKMPSIAYGLFDYQYKMQRQMDTPVYFAALILTAIPTIILYLCFQDKILQQMNIGGLKG